MILCGLPAAKRVDSPPVRPGHSSWATVATDGTAAAGGLIGFPARAHPELWVPSHRTVLLHTQQLSEENATLADIQHFPGNARWYQSSTAAQAGLDKTESASKNGNSETWKAEDVKLQYISVPLAKSSLFLWEKADGSYK